MSKVKLNLQQKDYVALAAFAKTHKDAMVGNANFTTPTPTALDFDESLTTYNDSMTQIREAEVAMQVLRAKRDDARVVLEGNLNARGAYVNGVANGVDAVILSAAFEVQASPSTTTSMEKPYNQVATMGDNHGEIDVGCHAVPKAKGYIYQLREHSDNAAPGTWGSDKFVTRSSCVYQGLVSGLKYAFRIRALGPNELESPWSDEVICMAP